MVNETINNTINETVTAAAPIIVRNSRWIKYFPNWVIILFCLVAGAFIFHYLPDDIKRPLKRFLRNWWGYILLFGLWLYYRKRWGFVFQNIDKFPGQMLQGDFYAMFILMIMLIARFFLTTEKYYTSVFVSDTVQGACNRYQQIGDLVVLFIGTTGSSTDKIVIPWFFPDKLVVTHIKYIEFKNDKIVCHAHVPRLKNFSKLDPSVRNFIETDTFARFGMQEVYYGLSSTKRIIEDPDYEELMEKYTNLSAKYNKLQDEFDEVTDNTERYGGHIRRMNKMFKDDKNERPRYEVEEQ